MSVEGTALQTPQQKQSGSSCDATGSLDAVVRRTVSIKILKEYARDRLPRDSPLREVLLAEEDHISVNEFLGKIKTWLVLVRQTGGT